MTDRVLSKNARWQIFYFTSTANTRQPLEFHTHKDKEMGTGDEDTKSHRVEIEGALTMI